MWPAHLGTMFQSRKVAPHPAPSSGASTEHLLICTSCSSSKAWALAIPGRSELTSTAYSELGPIMPPFCVCFFTCKTGAMRAKCLCLEKIAVRISRDCALKRVVLNLALLPFIRLMSFILAVIFQGHSSHTQSSSYTEIEWLSCKKDPSFPKQTVLGTTCVFLFWRASYLTCLCCRGVL